MQYFRPTLLKFLKQLKRNNNREWFQKHKPIYETELKAPMLKFISDLRDPLLSQFPYLKVDPKPVGGSMLRIYRDVRFSEDKSPYKTNTAAHFPHKHSSKDMHTPGFYLHLQPGDCFIGAGMWRPDSASLSRIRNHMVDYPEQWEKFKKTRLPLWGESLKKAPRGYDPGHRFVDDLKRRDFITWVEFSEKQVSSSRFMKDFIRGCEKTEPLMAFLCRAMGLGW